jgi:hypothetical protein
MSRMNDDIEDETTKHSRNIIYIFLNKNSTFFFFSTTEIPTNSNPFDAVTVER